MIQEGDLFPEFNLLDQHGQRVTRDDLLGSKTVVYFYPKDDTPGCTAEACDFRDHQAQVGARIIGVSPDSTASHLKFATKFGLEFTLLADVGHSLCEAAGVWKEKSMMGKKYMGVERTTILLDEHAVVTNVWQKVKVPRHVKDVLTAVQSI